MSKVNTSVTIPQAQTPLHVALAAVQKTTNNNVQSTMLKAYVKLLQTHAQDDIKQALASPNKEERAAGNKTPLIVGDWLEMGYAESTAAKMHSQLRALVAAWYSGAMVDGKTADVVIANAPGYQKAIDVAVSINQLVKGKKSVAKEVSGLAEHIAAAMLRTGKKPDELTAEEKIEIQDNATLAFDVHKEIAAHNALVETAQKAADKVNCLLIPREFDKVEQLVEFLSQNGYFTLAQIEKAIVTRRGKAPASIEPATIEPAPVVAPVEAMQEA